MINQGQLTYHQAHKAGIKKVVFCEDQQLLVTLSYDRTLAFWHMSSTGIVSQQRRTNMPDIIWPRAAALLGKDQLVLGTFGARYAIYDWRIDLWHSDDIEIGPGINTITYHRNHVYTVGDAGIVAKNEQPYAYLGSLCNFLLSAGNHLFSGGQLGELFDVHTGKSVYQHHSPLNCGALFYRHNQAHLAIGTYTGEMLIFSINDDQSVKFEQTLSVFENAIKGIAVNQQQIFSVCASTDIAWHDCQDLSLIRKQTKAHDKIANACCAIGDQGFASVSRDLHLRLWLDDQTQIYLTPHLNSVKCIAASADGQMLMTGSYTGTVAGFDLTERRWRIFERPTHAGISALTYDPIKQCFLAASYDGQIYPVAH